MNIILTWTDTRISPAELFKLQSQVPIRDSLIHSCFWIPKFYAVPIKSMESYHGDFIEPAILVSKNGSIAKFTDYKFTVFCKMHLELFPVDIQSCQMIFQSYRISRTMLQFAKIKINTHRYFENSDLIYDLIYSDEISSKESEAISSRLTLCFVFKRRLHLSLMTTYFPSLLATIVSFTSFWIHPDAVPGRVTLGVTCLLAVMTQMISVRSAIINMNYVTGIDIWFLACITFISLSMFEFALSYTLSRGRKIKTFRVIVPNPSKVTKLKSKLFKLTIDQFSRVLFPVALFCFVLCYFVVLLSLVQRKENASIHHKH